MTRYMVFKSVRFLATMLISALVTSFVLMVAVPHIGQPLIVFSSVVVALLISVYDFGLLSDEFEV